MTGVSPLMLSMLSATEAPYGEPSTFDTQVLPFDAHQRPFDVRFTVKRVRPSDGSWYFFMHAVPRIGIDALLATRQSSCASPSRQTGSRTPADLR